MFTHKRSKYASKIKIRIKDQNTHQRLNLKLSYLYFYTRNVCGIWWIGKISYSLKMMKISKTSESNILHSVKSVSIRSYSVRMRENTDEKNSEYGHFSRSVSFKHWLLLNKMVLTKSFLTRVSSNLYICIWIKAMKFANAIAVWNSWCKPIYVLNSWQFFFV